jgi:hypothetical protein
MISSGPVFACRETEYRVVWKMPSLSAHSEGASALSSFLALISLPVSPMKWGD